MLVPGAGIKSPTICGNDIATLSWQGREDWNSFESPVDHAILGYGRHPPGTTQSFGKASGPTLSATIGHQGAKQGYKCRAAASEVAGRPYGRSFSRRSCKTAGDVKTIKCRSLLRARSVGLAHALSLACRRLMWSANTLLDWAQVGCA